MSRKLAQASVDVIGRSAVKKDYFWLRRLEHFHSLRQHFAAEDLPYRITDKADPGWDVKLGGRCKGDLGFRGAVKSFEQYQIDAAFGHDLDDLKILGARLVQTRREVGPEAPFHGGDGTGNGNRAVTSYF